MATKKKAVDEKKVEEKKAYTVLCGPFQRRLKARELAKNGASVEAHDGAYWVRMEDLSKSDANIMVKSLNGAGYTAKVL